MAGSAWQIHGGIKHYIESVPTQLRLDMQGFEKQGFKKQGFKKQGFDKLRWDRVNTVPHLLQVAGAQQLLHG